MIIVIRKCLAISYHAVKCCSLLSREAARANFPSTSSSAEKAYWQQFEEGGLFLSSFDICTFSRSSFAPERSAPPSNPSVKDYRKPPFCHPGQFCKLGKSAAPINPVNFLDGIWMKRFFLTSNERPSLRLELARAMGNRQVPVLSPEGQPVTSK